MLTQSAREILIKAIAHAIPKDYSWGLKEVNVRHIGLVGTS
jgi:hypothetical protein